jgi:hypothetical protein
MQQRFLAVARQMVFQDSGLQRFVLAFAKVKPMQGAA